MNISIIKGESSDRIEVARADGSRTGSSFPHKGPAPHDAVHLIVERAFGLTDAFWGMIARGHAAEDIQTLAKEGGHPSAGRAGIPDDAIVELLQAERLVECFEAALWDSHLDVATFQSVAAVACESSHVPAPALPDDVIRAVDAEVRTMTREWGALAVGERLSFDWPV